jgi:hypothetical protein
VNPLIVKPDSSRVNPNGQHRIAPRAGRAAGCLLLVLVLELGGIGCRSIYHETRASYPADPCARLRLRITEAQQAETRVAQAATRLRDRFAQGVGGQNLEPDVDRLETAVREFGRRTATVHDAAATCNQPSELAVEMSRLQLRFERMLETTVLIRRDGMAAARPRLDALLHNAIQP